MEQITKEIVIDFIKKNQIELHATQTKLCLPIINRLYRKMSIGLKFNGIKVSNDLIIDGHHRYLASRLANFDLDKYKSQTTTATVVTKWNSIDYVIEDWDSDDDILKFNQLDAEYNGIENDKIVELLK